MSYCRFAWNGSDVYVYDSDDGIICCACAINKAGFSCELPEDMISHLAEHRRRGSYVPPYAIEALWQEITGATKPSKPEPARMKMYAASRASEEKAMKPLVRKLRRQYGKCGECGQERVSKKER